MRIRRRRGMSLVEIMVTIAIVVTISSVLAISVMHVWQEANVGSTKLTMSQVGQEVVSYSLRKGRVPTTSEGLAALGRSAPLDAWGRPFEYRAPGRDGSQFELMSLGRDGESGGADLNEDLVWVPEPD